MSDIKLLKGQSYTYKNKTYIKGNVVKDVPNDVHKYLMTTGRFGDANAELYSAKKAAQIAKVARSGPRTTIKLDEETGAIIQNTADVKETAPKKPAVKAPSILADELLARIASTRSKQGISDIASEEFGVTLESDKLKPMKEELIKALTEKAIAERTGADPSDGPAIPV